MLFITHYKPLNLLDLKLSLNPGLGLKKTPLSSENPLISYKFTPRSRIATFPVFLAANKLNY